MQINEGRLLVKKIKLFVSMLLNSSTFSFETQSGIGCRPIVTFKSKCSEFYLQGSWNSRISWNFHSSNLEVPFMFFLERVFGQIDNISRFYSNLRFVHRETIVSKHLLLQQSYQSIFAAEVPDVSALGKDSLPILTS